MECNPDVPSHPKRGPPKDKKKSLTMRANICIPLPRPTQPSPNHILEVQSHQPLLPLCRKLPSLNLARQLPRPLQRAHIRLPPPPHPAPNPPLGNTRVPHVVQVQLAPLPQHMDAIAAAGDVLIVQRLVDVADKVHDELGGLRAQPRGQVRVEHLRRVVLDGRHDAALGFAVAREVDGARVRGRVFGVDEVEGPRVVRPLGVADGVGPGRDVGEVVGRVVAEEGLEVVCCLRLDEVAG